MKIELTDKEIDLLYILIRDSGLLGRAEFAGLCPLQTKLAEEASYELLSSSDREMLD